MKEFSSGFDPVGLFNLFIVSTFLAALETRQKALALKTYTPFDRQKQFTRNETVCLRFDGFEEGGSAVGGRLDLRRPKMWKSQFRP